MPVPLWHKQLQQVSKSTTFFALDAENQNDTSSSSSLLVFSAGAALFWIAEGVHFKTWLMTAYLPYHYTRALSISKDLTRLRRQQYKRALAPGFWARARYESGIRLLAQMLKMDGKIRKEGKRTEEREGQWADWDELEEE